MKTFTRLWLLAAIALGCLILIAAGNSAIKPISSQEGLVNVDNKASGFVLTSIQEEQIHGDKYFALTFANNYDKPVVAYSLEQTGGGGQTMGGEMTAWRWLPGEKDICRVKADKAGKFTATLVGVLFTDGTGVGEAKFLAKRQGFRLGVKIQYQKALNTLQEADRKQTSAPTAQLQMIQNMWTGLPDWDAIKDVADGLGMFPEARKEITTSGEPMEFCVGLLEGQKSAKQRLTAEIGDAINRSLANQTPAQAEQLSLANQLELRLRALAETPQNAR